MRNPFIGRLLVLRGLLLLIIALDFEVTLAQNNIPVEWTRYNLLTIDPTWKYNAGVLHPEYTLSEFDDHTWRTIHDDSLYALLNTSSTWAGVGVFRKTLMIPDSLVGRRLEFILMNQVGAIEIFLDGKQLLQLGKVGKDRREEITRVRFNPLDPIPVVLDNQTPHVLTISFSNHLDKKTTEQIGYTGFGTLLSLHGASTGQHEPFPHFIISLFVIFGFCLFFGFVYAFYPNRLASLISTLFLANFSLIFAGAALRDATYEVDLFIFADYVWRLAFSSYSGWLLLFMYSIYYNRIPKRAWIVGGLMIIGAAIVVYSFSVPFYFILPMVVLFQLETWRIIILGVRKGKTGFWILAIGFFLSLVGSLTAIWDVFDMFPQHITTGQTVLAVFTDLLAPLTLALQFAWEFGSANRDLRTQVISINSLSQKNLEQEQEKQQILATQNETLEQQVSARTSEVVAKNKEIEKQRDQVTNTLEELRATQTQLIQSEKMASLGELTAGIAHEIQNPLNFVNNFSEVNRELIDELKAEIDKGNYAEVLAIAKDVEENEAKINHHGKRADAIVKGMLQHSRSSSGVKEPTDINALADEYLRLAYHGLRAKDKSFNAALNTDFDKSIGTINVVPQDMGRVILNLITNAFYAVAEKKKTSDDSYEPAVHVSTKKTAGFVTITVQDNGNGIPAKVLDKIFQPFFTTKPTGQGTGLGLSLSYDIVKAHSGELKVKTTELLGSEFTITLPIA